MFKIRYGKASPKETRSAGGHVPVFGSAGEMARTTTALVSDPCIVIGRKGNVGQTHLVMDGAWPTDTTYYVRMIPEIDPKFLQYQLVALDLRRLDSSTATPSLRRQDLESVQITWPKLNEQLRIVEILEDHLSRLDAAGDQLHQVRRRLAALRRASQEIAVAPSHESWRHLSVDQITDGDRTRIVIGPFGSDLTTRDYRTEGIPLVFVRNVRARDFALEQKFVDPNKAAALSSHRVVDGDVVITKMGDPPGDTAVYRGKPAVITADIIRLRPSREHDPDFVALALSASNARRQMLSITSGVAQKKVSLARFRSTVSLTLPPLHVQRQRMETHRATCEAIDRMDGVVASSIDRSRALRRAVLAAAFSGKLIGSRTDPEAIEEAV
jgi:type I restriction enzyme, S subunit